MNSPLESLVERKTNMNPDDVTWLVAFQKRHELPADGIVGPLTAVVLIRELRRYDNHDCRDNCGMCHQRAGLTSGWDGL